MQDFSSWGLSSWTGSSKIAEITTFLENGVRDNFRADADYF
jgi:hypothetical protein